VGGRREGVRWLTVVVFIHKLRPHIVKHRNPKQRIYGLTTFKITFRTDITVSLNGKCDGRKKARRWVIGIGCRVMGWCKKCLDSKMGYADGQNESSYNMRAAV
jgi:hypothetical protein